MQKKRLSSGLEMWQKELKFLGWNQSDASASEEREQEVPRAGPPKSGPGGPLTGERAMAHPRSAGGRRTGSTGPLPRGTPTFMQEAAPVGP